MIDRKIRGRELEILCRKCKGFGFTGDVPFTEAGWAAKDVFELGVACFCPAGAEFALAQMEWHKPMPARAGGAPC